MFKPTFSLFIGLITASVILLSACTKIDITTLGSDLIPAVDNVNTFDTSLTVNSGSSQLFLDSTRIGRDDANILGSINNDPIFGKSKGDLFAEFKPPFYPYFFGNVSDTINPVLDPRTGFDSVVLCVTVNGYYGDTTIPQRFQVYRMSNATTNFRDSLYLANFQPNAPYTQLLGQAIVQPSRLREFVKFRNGKDSVNNQIRIPLNNAFLNELISQDSTENGLNNAYFNDSLFKRFLTGLAVVSDASFGGNCLIYTSLTDSRTRMEIHYRRKNKNQVDTTFSAFRVSIGTIGGSAASATANYFERNRSGAEFPGSPLNDAVYMQTTPGSFVHLNIPGLSTFENAVVHRAELVMEQIPFTANPALDRQLETPAFLYLDLLDSTPAVKYKPIYFDLSPSVSYFPDNNLGFFPTGGIDFSYHGGFIRYKNDQLTGLVHGYYNFNVSRYVQNLITRRGFNYTLRLQAPSVLNYYGFNLAFQNRLANGRVRLGGGNNPNYRMRLRIIYSKI